MSQELVIAIFLFIYFINVAFICRKYSGSLPGVFYRFHYDIVSRDLLEWVHPVLDLVSVLDYSERNLLCIGSH